MARAIMRWLALALVCGILMGAVFDLDDYGPQPGTDLVAVMFVVPAPGCATTSDEMIVTEAGVSLQARLRLACHRLTIFPARLVRRWQTVFVGHPPI